MAIITVADVLKHAEAFEQMLVEYYSKLSERTAREGVRLLTDYMSRHQTWISEALKKLPSDQVSRICNSPLRYEPQAADCRCFEGMELSADATAAQVLDAAITFDECLVSLYRQVVQQPVDEETRELFESLIRAEKNDEIRLKKTKALDYF